jgi:hypothetical protein
MNLEVWIETLVTAANLATTFPPGFARRYSLPGSVAPAAVTRAIRSLRAAPNTDLLSPFAIAIKIILWIYLPLRRESA